MMQSIRVLIVDDSVVVRRLLARIIEEAEGMEVVGLAANGRLALEMLDQADPDLVTLDVEMPEMDGLATLCELRRRRPRLPVIMFSTLTSRGAATTIEALSRGASDYLTKPENSSGLAESLESLRQELVPRVRALARQRRSESPATAHPVPPAKATPGVVRTDLPARQRTMPPIVRPPAERRIMPPPSGRTLTKPAELLVIGISTGGPNALAILMPQFPADLPVPVLIVQHMPPLFTKMLADRLDQLSRLKVREMEAGAKPSPGEVWVARGDWHMIVAREGGRLVLREHQGPQVNSCRPAVDVLFSSTVPACSGGILAMVLTGMGQDGLRGARSIHEAGGMVLAQDEESSVVWGMPGAVANAGIADEVLPLTELASKAVQVITASRTTRPTSGRAGAWR